MAKKTITKIDGARFLSNGGSLIFCENCGKIVGSVNKYGYKYLYLLFVCTCGYKGEIEVIRDGHFNDYKKLINKAPKTKLGVFICNKCDTPLISMIDERVQSYTYYTECICGEKFDAKPKFNERLGETLKAYKKMKKLNRD